MLKTTKKIAQRATNQTFLLLAGGLLGVTAEYTYSKIPENTHKFWLFVIIFFTFFFAYIGFGNGIKLWRPIRWLNRKRRVISVYAPYKLPPPNKPWIKLTPLKIMSLAVKYSPNFPVVLHEYELCATLSPVVINPYGGAYPELNIPELESLDGILRWVLHGGIYINLADIPFYYAIDFNRRIKVDTTRIGGTIFPEPTFIDSQFTKKTGIKVWRLENMPATYRGFEVDGLSTIALTKKYRTINHFSGCPIKVCDTVALNYGKGYFLFSTKPINSKNARAILKLLINKAHRILDGQNIMDHRYK